MEGWVKLHRKITEWKYFKNSEIYHLFTTLVLLANHKEGFTKDGTKVKAGQLMTSYRSLSSLTGLSESKIFRITEKLKIEKQIEKHGTPKNTIISIVNYDDYQAGETVVEMQMKHGRNTGEKQAKTNKNAKNGNNGKNTNTGVLFPVEAPEVEVEESIDQTASNVLTMLNALAFKAFQPVPGNMKYINARLKEGYKLDDFKKVIEHKLAKWGNDPEMAYCIRPQTLFGSKFDSYLQEASDPRLKELEENALIEKYLPGFTA